MSSITIDDLHIHELLKDIKDLEVSPDGQDIAICGANATGKTSISDPDDPFQPCRKISKSISNALSKGFGMFTGPSGA